MTVDIKDYQVINKDDFDYYSRAWFVSFVTFGPAEIVLSDNTQNALDHYADWCDDNCPGVFMSESDVDKIVQEFGYECDIMRIGNFSKPVSLLNFVCNEIDFSEVKRIHKEN